MDWFPLWLSLRVAAIATLIAATVGITGGYALAKYRFPGRRLVEAIATVPIVLPPTVLGYYLLVTIGRNTQFGEWWESVTGSPLVFTWKAAVVAASISALPFCLRTARAAIEDVDPRIEDAARTMGFPEWRVAAQVTLPLARRGITAGVALGFARALGEFGATVMIAGNIPGQTQTMPIKIYDAVQAGDFDTAKYLSLILTTIAVLVLLAVGLLERRPA